MPFDAPRDPYENGNGSLWPRMWQEIIIAVISGIVAGLVIGIIAKRSKLL